MLNPDITDITDIYQICILSNSTNIDVEDPWFPCKIIYNWWVAHNLIDEIHQNLAQEKCPLVI